MKINHLIMFVRMTASALIDLLTLPFTTLNLLKIIVLLI